MLIKSSLPALAVVQRCGFKHYYVAVKSSLGALAAAGTDAVRPTSPPALPERGMSHEAAQRFLDYGCGPRPRCSAAQWAQANIDLTIRGLGILQGMACLSS